MNSDSNAIINRIEIFLYSTLISCMSAVGRIRAHSDQSVISPYPEAGDKSADSLNLVDELTTMQPDRVWSSISNAVVPLLIWMVLGFAAGFLIGMINPG